MIFIEYIDSVCSLQKDLNKDLIKDIEDFRQIDGSCFFVEKDKALVTLLNSYPFYLKTDFLESLFATYGKLESETNGSNLKCLMAEFLLTYYKSLFSRYYKVTDFENRLKELKSIFSDYLDKKNYNDIYSSNIYKDAKSLYCNILGTDNPKSILRDIYKRIFFSLKKDDKNDYLNSIYKNEKLKNQNLYYLIDYDTDSKRIETIYLDTVKKYDSIVAFSSNIDFIKSLSKKLDKFISSYELNKYIFNKCATFFNEYNSQINNNNITILDKLFVLEQYLNIFNYLKTVSYKTIKEKSSSAVNIILSKKRNLLRDSSQNSVGLYSYSSYFNYNSKDVANIINIYLNKPILLYILYRFSIKEMLNKALNFYKSLFWGKLCTEIEYDTFDIGFSKMSEDKEHHDAFSDYINNMEILSKPDYVKSGKYEMLNKFLNTNFMTYIRTLCSLVSNKECEAKKKIIDLFCTTIDLDFQEKELLENSTYTLISTILVYSESMLCRIEDKQDSSPNAIEVLASLFIKHSDSEIKDKLFFVYYMLYSPYGPNIRNGVAHGSFFGKNDVFYILTICFASYTVINEIYFKETKNE